MKRKAVFFDRDGVLNYAIIKDGKPLAPLSIKDLRIYEDALSALKELHAAGFVLIGATNQPDARRGLTTRENVEEINEKLLDVLPLLEIRVCFHIDEDECQCRKPLPGLLTEAAREHDLDLKNSVMIGDRWKDIEAGQRAGCKTVLLKHTNYEERDPLQPSDFITTSLTTAVIWIKETMY
jgi:D-glycero-D-manno-heptose 1,7-bisphosphate phosphatase